MLEPHKDLVNFSGENGTRTPVEPWPCISHMYAVIHRADGPDGSMQINFNHWKSNSRFGAYYGKPRMSFYKRIDFEFYTATWLGHWAPR